MTSLAPADYRELLQAALPSAADADTITPTQQNLFTPNSHRRALDLDATVVRGGRGVGKTVWFRSLQDDSLRALAADFYHLPLLRQVTPLAGFGAAMDERYPGPATLARLVENGIDPETIWTTVLLHALQTPEVVARQRWEDRARWVGDHPEEWEQALAEADRFAADRGTHYLLLFDALDHLHRRRSVTDRLVEGILRLALRLRLQTRRLRAKVFIRHDMFSDAVLRFPDASKLTANAAELVWYRQHLYGLLFHDLGNCGHDLAGRHMGTDYRRGVTYKWLPNHLQDGAGQVSPRSFLRTLATATEQTALRYAGHDRALHWDAIRHGVQEASRVRVNEITEDMPWVATVMKPLQGMQVPMEQEDLLTRWRQHRVAEELGSLAEPSDEQEIRTGPQHADDYPGLLGELVELGVMTRRADGRVDVPDVYRIAFELGRKGGVPRMSRESQPR